MPIFEQRTYTLCMHAIDIMDEIYHQGGIQLNAYFSRKTDDEIVTSFFQFGLTLISEGATINRFRLMLDCEKMKWIKRTNSTSDDLQLISITEKLLLALHAMDLALLHEYCYALLPNNHNEINQRFWSIDPDFE